MKKKTIELEFVPTKLEFVPKYFENSADEVLEDFVKIVKLLDKSKVHYDANVIYGAITEK